MQFPRRGGRLFLLLFGVTLGPFLLAVPAALWLGWTMNPVQNFYLGTYAACSVGTGIRGNLTAVRWAEKTASGRKSEPLLPADTVRGPDPKSPLALSSTAIAEGWRGVSITPARKVRSAELKSYLQTVIYDGDSIWWLLLRPMIYGLAGFLFLYALWLQFRQGFSRDRRREVTDGAPRGRSWPPQVGTGLRTRTESASVSSGAAQFRG
jgi:hypothetical protein